MLIKELDNYFDAVLRNDADPVEVGAFTLFVSDAPYGYYARPSSSHFGLMDAADLTALAEACRERDIDLAIEWVHEAHPGLGALAQGVKRFCSLQKTTMSRGYIGKLDSIALARLGL